MTSSSGLIQNGEFSSKSEFPWMASIVFTDVDHSSSGALVSRKHVVTRAGVLGTWNDEKTEFTAVLKSRLKIYLGSLPQVSDFNENAFNVKELILHPNLRYIDDVEADNVGIILLSALVEFTDFIRPVCLWTYGDDINLFKNLPIYAVGYGRDETGIPTKIRKHAKVVLIDDDDCQSKYLYAKNFFTENKAFCLLGNKNGSPCVFDECLFVKLNGKWFLRGIQLKSPLNENNSCNINYPFPAWYPFLYHDIAKNTKWIQNVVEK
jgi:hypothetical protein